MEAIADPPAYGRARAAVRYDEIARTLVHALKYGDRLDLAPIMGRWMANAGQALFADADALVPVPLHWRRQWARRFNQSALLAEVIAKASRRKVAHGALKRVKATPQQVGLDRSARAQNVQGAFRVPAEGTHRGRGSQAGAGRRCADLRRHRRRLCAHVAARRRSIGRRRWYSPGLWPQGANPYRTS